MLQAECVTDFMGRKLSYTSQRHLQHGIVAAGARASGVVGVQETLGNEVILADAQGSKQYVALDDLSGARIGDARAVAPAPSGAVDPVDDVVAYIQRIGAFGQYLHAEGINVPGRFKRFIPPPPPLEKG